MTAQNDARAALLAKIRRMMALAERGEGGEAETAGRLVRKLMHKHSITADDVEEAENPDETLVIHVGPTPWKQNIAMAAAKFCGVYVLRLSDRARRVPLEGWGTRSDLVFWQFIYEGACEHVEREAKKYGAQAPGRGAMRAFRLAAARAIAATLDRIRREKEAAPEPAPEPEVAPSGALMLPDRRATHPDAETFAHSAVSNMGSYTSTGTALVPFSQLVKQKTETAKERAHEHYPSIGTFRATRAPESIRGRREGREAGKKYRPRRGISSGERAELQDSES